MTATFAALAAQPGMVVLEGLHALKHALRFGAVIDLAITPSLETVLALTAELAPDLLDVISALVVEVDDFPSRQLGSPVLAVARKRAVSVERLLSRDGSPVVLLEEPRHAGNAGAVVRVAAAAGIRGVVMTGGLDPWSAPVVRAAAGLHYAVEVARAELPLATDRPIVALDPDGNRITADLPAGCVLAFGSERHGLSAGLLERADRVCRLPMRPGVSSLNLATSVSAVLYACGLAVGE